MFSHKIVVSPDLVIRIRAYPIRRRRALRALRVMFPKTVALCLGPAYLR